MCSSDLDLERPTGDPGDATLDSEAETDAVLGDPDRFGQCDLCLVEQRGERWPTYAGDVKVKIGETVVRTPTDDALGYVRREVATNDVDADRAVIEKNDEGISWGAVYAQYVADMREVRSQGEALTVRRELVKDGRPVDGATDLHVGDRLTVRLTVTDYEIGRASCRERV